MRTYRFLCSVAVVSLLASACTQQQAAEIVYKGSQFFGRDREEEPAINSAEHKTYSSDSPRYKPGYVRPVEPAEVPAVAVSELPPPVAVESSPSDKVLASKEPSSGGNAKQVMKIKEDAVAKPAKVVSEVTEKPLASSGLKEPKAKSEIKEQQVASLDTSVTPAREEVDDSKDHPKFIWPVDGGKIISRFKPSADKDKGKGHDGINISMGEGEPIFAAAPGTVVYSGNDLKGYGNMVIIRHEGGWMTAYAHARSLNVKKGEKVKQGALIAYVGTTGGVKEPQLHFAMRKGKVPVDPQKYLPKA